MNKDDPVTERESNYAHVLERVAKTETSVQALENDMRTVMAGVSDIRGMLMDSQKGKDPNYGLWIGLVAAGLLGVAQYVDITLEPIEQLINARQEVIENFGSFKHEMHYEVGRLHENKELMAKEFAELDSRVDGAEASLSAVESKASTTRDRVERVEDELEKIDLYGSRRWGVHPNE